MTRYLCIGGRRHGTAVELHDAPWTIELDGQGYRRVEWWHLSRPVMLYVQHRACVSATEITELIRKFQSGGL